MANKTQGVVKRIYTKEVGAKKTKTFSFQIDGDPAYYRLNFTSPADVGIREGANIEFSWNQGQYGPDVDVKSIVQSSAPVAAKPAYAAKGGNTKDDYWAKKEAYDKEVTAPIIHFQSAYNVAATIVTQALAKDILPLPAKAGDKFDAYLEMVHTVQQDLYDRITRKKQALENGDEEVSSAQVLTSVAEATEDNTDWS